MNVFDWLSALPLHDSAKPYPVIEVTFNKGSRKDFYRNNTNHIFEKGEWIALEGVSGFDMGQVSLTGELVKLQMKKYGVEDQPTLKRVLRPATDEDFTIFNTNKEREAEMLTRSRAMAKAHNLDMKLCEVEIQADGKKATFFYTADSRVDFRELIKSYAGEFKVKVEMKQIGARQESGKVGGIGSCGRELCCSTWLTDFKSVNTTAARYQNLSINQTKLSGQCGRLKCCLNYELDTYMDALRVFPDNAEALETAKGKAYLQKKDIFKNLMWYSYPDSSKQYPLAITRVKEILTMNKQGQKADELQPVELEVSSNKAGMKVEMGFVNDVGQISLRALEKSSKKKKSNNKGGGQKQGSQQAKGGNQPQQKQGSNQQQRPQGGQQPKQGHQQGGGNPPKQGGSQQQPKQGGQQQRPQGNNQQRPQGNQQPKQQGDGQQKQGGNRPNNKNRDRGPRPPKQENPPKES
jgi:cell fate regulator YaaT (PSP1 superfamily)